MHACWGRRTDDAGLWGARVGRPKPDGWMRSALPLFALSAWSNTSARLGAVHTLPLAVDTVIIATAEHMEADALTKTLVATGITHIARSARAALNYYPTPVGRPSY